MEDYFIVFMFVTVLFTLIAYSYLTQEKLDKLQKELEWVKKRLN
jgi:hypothetical protein